MNTDGLWSRRQGGRILLLDDGVTGELETPNSFPPANARVLSLNDVDDSRIDKPAQTALVRMSRNTATAATAASLLDMVKQGRIAGIRCLNSKDADARAQRLGSSALNAMAPGENAVLLLDPTDLRSGAPIIAFSRALHPGCGLDPGQKTFSAHDSKLDAALVRALASYQTWRGGLQLGRVARCGLNPIHAVVSAGQRTIRPASNPARNDLLPRLICQTSAVASTPGMPIQVRHRHLKRICTLESDEPKDELPVVDLLPANMTPRYIAADDSLIPFPPLQDLLTDIMVKQFPKFLTAPSLRDRKASLGDKVRVAVVDLTSQKLCRPHLAGWGETFNGPGASTPKMMLVYASHQMLFDLQDLARRESIEKKKELFDRASQEWSTFACKPKLEFLFTVKDGKPAAVEFSPAHVKLLNEVVGPALVGTPSSSTLIMKLGFEYIASVAWQSGLRHPKRGGMWFGSTFCGGADPDKPDSNCHVKLVQGSGCGTGQSRVVWTKDPLGVKSIVGSALSFATMLTLLAQGRLASTGMSRRIEVLLAKACSHIAQTAKGGTRLRANKCGVAGAIFNDVSLMEHGTGMKKRRWVLAFMSEGLDPEERKHLRSLVPAVHDMIAKSNP